MKKPFLHALGAALYIVVIVFITQTVTSLLKSQNETIITPMTMLSLFVLSAAVMGFLFLSEPLYLLMENKKQEAIIFFAKVVGFFACFVAFFTILLFLNSTFVLQPNINKIKEQITYSKASRDLIIFELPFPGAVTGKEFSVIGKARGVWFFEASFPIDVLDKDGKILVQTFATAEGEWMTDDFVPFKGEVKVPESYIGPATLILKKDNASGLPEHDASISFPIVVEY